MPELIKKERPNIKLEFVSSDQLIKELSELLKDFGADPSQADLKKTRQILSRVSSLNEELMSLRDEDE